MQAQIVQQGTFEVDTELVHAEERIERATRNAFYEVGLELRHIRDSRLYRQQYGTFEEYCESRWEWDRQHVYRLIDAAGVIEQMSPIGDILPSRESHVRPLLRLESPEHRAEVWQRTVFSAQHDNQRITAKMVEAEVERKLAELKKDWYTLAEWQALSEIDKHHILTQPYTSDAKFNETNDNIEWAAFSWNPVTGCNHDCHYCYARDIAHRFFPQEFVPSFLPSRLVAPRNTKPPAPRWQGDCGNRGVFVCSMADLFGDWVPQEWIDAVLREVKLAPQWTFIFLTKNPIRLIGIDWPANAWVGATVDTQERVEVAEEAFKNVQASVRFLSCEPLKERLTFSSLDMFEWVIIGGQSKTTGAPEAQPEWEWVWWLETQARRAGIPGVYMKTNLTVRSKVYPNTSSEM